MMPSMSNDSAGPEAASIGNGPAGDAFAVGRTSRLRRPLLLLAPVALILVGLYFYFASGGYETTDNAALQSGQVAITANVSGQVIAIDVRENQRVSAGQVLFRIGPGTFKTTVDEASAQLAAARADVAAQRAIYRQQESELQAARARLAYNESEVARQQSLLAEGIASQAQFDAAALASRTARDAIDAAQAKAASVLAGLSGNAAAPIESQPQVRRAQAALERAQIALGDAEVRAPQDGVVTRVNQLQVGDYVNASRPVFVLTGTQFWVEANFRENQLRYMRVGQSATVHIDAFPEHDLKAHVASFSPGTGNSFNVLPAENATGNWVKVVQRLPVQVALDQLPQDRPLHAGLSVEVKVDTGRHRGF
jgi:membrane fusion protein (multidrug efflux system)